MIYEIFFLHRKINGMKKKNLILVLMLFLVEDCAQSQVLCMAKNTGAVFVRKTCKKRESKLDPVALGLVGPAGPTGPTGPQGPAGATGAQGSTGPTANIDSLTARVVTLESNNISGLSSVMSYNSSTKLVRFSGANVQIDSGNDTVNGLVVGQTASNGYGNLTVGVNATNSGSSYCSYSNYTSQSTCETAGGSWSNNQRSGSNNLIIGQSGNDYTNNGNLIQGNTNRLTGASSISLGGSSAVVAGSNIILKDSAGSFGGYYNTLSSGFAFGGQLNTISSNSLYSVIVGGQNNTLTGIRSTISGGIGLTVNANDTWYAGNGTYHSP